MPLSNATQQILNTRYFDDFYAASNVDPSITHGEDFDFLRILFKPGVAIQSRELTQIQTLLQAQLERLGKSSFKDGDAVFGGCLTLDTSVTSGQVLPTTNLVALFDRSTNNGQFVFEVADPSIKAHVLQFLSADEGQTSNSYLLFKLQAAAPFQPGTVIQSALDPTVTATFAAGNPSDVFKAASIVSIDEGVFFVEGFFVAVPKQTIVLNPFSELPSYRVGLSISEQILDELDLTVGNTLLDPANQNAPGADRFRIVLTLDKRDLNTSADTGFIELMRVVDGQVLQSKKTPKFVRLDELTAILARRTTDEAGDYIVNNFTPVINDNPDDDTTFLLSLGPGKAYVRGYEIATHETTNQIIRKGRVTQNANNRSIPVPVGNFVYATRLAATQPLNYFANTAVVDLHCVNVASLNIASSTVYTQSKIGQAKVRMVESFEVPTLPSLFSNNSIYKLFFYDVAGLNLTGNITSSTVNNNIAITCVIPLANGTPAVNGAIEGATIVLSGATSPVTGTFTVNNYVVANSTAAFVTLVEYLPTLPNNNTAYKLIFQTKDVDCFALFDGSVTAIVSPYASNLSFQADVHIDSKVGGAPTGPTMVSDTTDNVLLYQIPEKFIKANSISTNTAMFKSWVSASANAQAFGSAANANFTITVAGANFSVVEGALSAAVATENLMIFDQTVDSNGHGVVVQFEDAPAATDRCISNVSVTAVGSNYNIAFTYNFGSNTATTRSLTGVAKTIVTGFAVRQKTLIRANTSNVQTSAITALDAGQIEFYSLNVATGFAYSLKTTDVLSIKKVLYKSANTSFTNADLTTATDVTKYFTLDTGQRDNTYEYANLIVNAGGSSAMQPTGRLLVLFDWFKNSGRGYASVDSYVNPTNALQGLTYDNVPGYTSVKFNTTVSLRDVLDFRPMRSHTEFAAAALVFAANDATSNTTYLTSDANSYLIPVSDDVWFGSYEYFLARIDKVGLSFDGTFQVIEGLDSTTPKTPSDSSGSLLLFQLSVPPYTLVDANGVPLSVLLTTFNHKRYTMADLSSMDDRVSALQYYVALNSLETITKDTPVLDSNQNERFKNGIVVDNFHSGATADVGRADYTAALDTINGELRSAFNDFVIQFAPDIANSTSVGVTLVGDMAIPTYNTAPFVTQPLATHAISVNPFDVASFYGTVKLSPAVDTWKDTSSAPAQVVDLGGPTQAWVDANDPSFVNWGEWDQTWSGVVSSVPVGQAFTPPGWTPDNHSRNSETDLSWNDVTTATTYQRQGTQYEFSVTSAVAQLGNQVVDVSVVHNIRNRDVVFAADGMKPGANVYSFFDGTPVTNFVQQANVLQLAEQGTGAPPFFIGQTVYVKKALTGNVATVNGSASITGTGSFFSFELVPGQLVRITQGVNTFDDYVSTIASNTSAVLTLAAGITLATATLSTLTPVTVADIASRITGNTVQYTVKVVRAVRDASTDAAVPYALTAGCLRPDKMVLDGANTTTGAVLIVPASARANAASFTITSAVCESGMVRSYNSGTAALRFDTDIQDAAVATVGTVIYFVAGPGAGTSAKVVSYNAAIQTAVLDNSALSVTVDTIYSVGLPSTDGFIANNSVTSGRAGTVAGVFHIPNGEFAVGTRLFRLTDSANNVVADATTTAETNYEASGVSYTQQQVSVTSRALSLVRGGPQTQSFTVTDTTVNGFTAQYVDPLAETFLVDATAFPQGVFITSIDFCFASKPTDDIPITLEIRPVVNGYPSSNQLVPCVGPSSRATVTIRQDAVQTSDTPDFTNPQTVTTFTFEAPVQLMPGQEFALVLRSDSDLYTVYTAELGGTVIGSDAKVSKQPYAGSFFKSQNASTWTESPLEDLMFRINRAIWSGSAATPQTGILVGRGIAPVANTSFDSYEFYPHEVQFGDLTHTGYTIDVKPLNLATNDLTGEVAARYNVQPNTWSLLGARSMVQGSGGSQAANNIAGRIYPFSGPAIAPANTVDALITLSTNSPDVAPFVDLQKINMLCIKHLINDMSVSNTNVSLVNPGAGYLANLQTGSVTTTSTSPTVTGNASVNFSLTITPGDSVVIGGNLVVIVATVTDNTHFNATANVGATRAANSYYTYGALGGNNTVALTVTDTYGSGALGYSTVARNGTISGVVLTANGTGYIDTPTFVIPSPTVPGGDYTLTQTQALLGFDSELSPTGGNALTRYLTRQVTLASGFDARDIQVTFDAYRPLGSHFYVYYAVLPGDSTARFQDQPWRLMTMQTPDNSVATSYYQFKEYTFVTPNGRALDAPGDTSDKFQIFAVKVVMACNETVDVPRIANFRAIALDE